MGRMSVFLVMSVFPPGLNFLIEVKFQKLLKMRKSIIQPILDLEKQTENLRRIVAVIDFLVGQR